MIRTIQIGLADEIPACAAGLSRKSLCMAAECERRNGLHLFEDWHYFELPEANEPGFDPTRPGGLVVTTLYNDTQPLIRYRIDDEVILSGRRCDCGRSTAMIEKPPVAKKISCGSPCRTENGNVFIQARWTSFTFPD